MDYLAECEFETAYKSEARSFTAEFFSRCAKQEDASDEEQDTGDVILTTKEGPTDLERCLVIVRSRLSGVSPSGDEPTAKQLQRYLKSFFISDEQLFRSTKLDLTVVMPG